VLIGLLVGLVVGGALGLVAGVLAAGSHRSDAPDWTRDDAESVRVADIAEARRARTSRPSGERVVPPASLPMADAPEAADTEMGLRRRGRIVDRIKPR
jgi:hypothetical protein